MWNFKKHLTATQLVRYKPMITAAMRNMSDVEFTDALIALNELTALVDLETRRRNQTRTSA